MESPAYSSSGTTVTYQATPKSNLFQRKWQRFLRIEEIHHAMVISHFTPGAFEPKLLIQPFVNSQGFWLPAGESLLICTGASDTNYPQRSPRKVDRRI